MNLRKNADDENIMGKTLTLQVNLQLQVGLISKKLDTQFYIQEREKLKEVSKFYELKLVKFKTFQSVPRRILKCLSQDV